VIIPVFLELIDFWPVLQRFRQVLGSDLIFPRQVSNGAREFQHPVVSAR
jgi:hypothetical protein